MRALIVCALGTLCLLIATPARGQSSVDVWAVYATFHLVETTRLRFTLLGGLAWYQTATDSQVLVEHLGPNGAVVAREEYNHHDNSLQRALAFGVELPIRVTRRLSVVPSFHSAWTPLADYGRDGFLRPSIGARWTF